jgi:hypothetical protein
MMSVWLVRLLVFGSSLSGLDKILINDKIGVITLIFSITGTDCSSECAL